MHEERTLEWDEQTLAYAAGFLDGEGCFYAAGGHWLGTRISAENSYKEVVFWLKNNFGGSIYKVKKQKDHHLQLYRWVIAGEEAINLCVALVPYLKEKSEQATILVELSKTKIDHKKHGRSLPQYIIQKRNDLKTLLKKLKKEKSEDKRDQDWWDKWFLGLAKSMASVSKDPSTGVVAILVSPDRTHCPYGYNGFPRKMEDKEEWLIDRTEKLFRTIHAEVNAIINAKCDLNGYTLYTYPFITCDKCALPVIQAGITRVVAPKLKTSHPRFTHWYPLFETAKKYYDECGVEYVEYNYS